MTNILQTIIAQFTHNQVRRLLAGASWLGCAFIMIACLNTTGRAQGGWPPAVQYYLNQATNCEAQGNSTCAATSLATAMRIYPPLAQSPQVVELLRTLTLQAVAQQKRANQGSYPTYTPTRPAAPRSQGTNNEAYRRCMEEARAMTKHPLDSNGSTVAQIYAMGACRELRDE